MSSLFTAAIVLLIVVVAYRIVARKLALRGHEVRPQEALARYEESAYILDVRTPEEYREGHIPGARLLPVGELGRRYGEVPRDKNVYIICRSGSRSAAATVWLLKKGYANVYNIIGGMNRWPGPVKK